MTIVKILIISGLVALFLSQFLPVNLTVSKGTLEIIDTWRTQVWGLPSHMLSKAGKILKYFYLTCFCVCMLLVAFGALNEF